MGLERLAQHLLDQGAITRAQLDEARRTQDFFGGQLGSYLLKLGFVDEQTLGAALSEVTAAPYASRDQFRAVAPEVVSRLPQELAEQWKACPFELEGRTLRVAMLNPRDARVVGEIARATGCVVEPWITCEYRLNQALERYYRVPAPRMISPATDGARERRARKTESAAEAENDGWTGEVGLDGRPLDADVSVDEQVYVHHGPGLPELDETAGEVDPAGRAAAADPLERLELRLTSADTPQAIAEALIEFCGDRARRAVLLSVGRDELRGVAGRGRGLQGERVRSIVLPVEPSTVLEKAFRGGKTFFGPVPPLPANRDLYSKLGGRVPVTALVLPIQVKGRLVAILHLDDEDRPMRRPEIPLMKRVVAKAALAFEVLLLRGKIRQI